MYAIPENSVLEIRMRATFNSQLVMNIFHYVNEQAIDNGQNALNEFGAAFEDEVWPIFQVPLSEAITDVRLDIQWVDPIRYRVFTRTPATDHGAAAGGSLPTGVAAVIRRFGDQANKHNQGRIYVFGVPLTKVSESRLTTTFLDDNKALWENVMVTILHSDTFGDANPIIWSAAAHTERIPVIGGLLDPIVRYQRRRELGVGQ